MVNSWKLESTLWGFMYIKEDVQCLRTYTHNTGAQRRPDAQGKPFCPTSHPAAGGYHQKRLPRGGSATLSQTRSSQYVTLFIRKHGPTMSSCGRARRGRTGPAMTADGRVMRNALSLSSLGTHTRMCTARWYPQLLSPFRYHKNIPT